MYPVTTGFLDKITARERNITARVEIDYTDPFLDQTIMVTANEVANISKPEQTADSLKDATQLYASLDGTWVLNDKYHLVGKFDQLGWWGKQLSLVDGSFVGPLPTLTVSFTKRPITKLSVVGDSARMEHPVAFNIYAYRGEELMHTEVVVDNNATEWLKGLAEPITGCDKMELEILRWSHPGRQVKIYEFFTSIKEVYSRGEIVDISLLDEMSNGFGSLPIGTVTSSELSVSLRNDSSNDRKFDAGNTGSPLHNLLKPNRRLKAWVGTEDELIPLGIFWSGDWNAPEDRVEVTTVGLDRLKFLSDTMYAVSKIAADVTLYDLTIDVLEDAGIKDYHIDISLKEIVIPVVPILRVSHREMLRYIAEMCLGNVYTNREGTIVVEGRSRAIARYDVSVSEKANISYEEQVVDEIDTMSKKYASLDGSWNLSGEYSLPPESDVEQFGWWGSQLSDANGSYAAPYPTLILQFQAKAIDAVKVVGDDKRQEYPVDFTVTVKDELGTVLTQQSITDNNEMVHNVMIPGNPTNAASVELSISKWSLPNRQVKIASFIDVKYSLDITQATYITKDNPIKYSDMINTIEVNYQPVDSLGEILPKQNMLLKDEDSISEYGASRFVVNHNPLLQTEEDALRIGQFILDMFGNPSRDLNLHWLGNPATMLRDTISLVDSREKNDYEVNRQELTYDGSLRGTIYGRRVLE